MAGKAPFTALVNMRADIKPALLTDNALYYTATDYMLKLRN